MSGLTVQPDEADVRVCPKKCIEIIGLHRWYGDIGIEASGTDCLGTHIPEGNSGRDQGFGTGLVAGRRAHPCEGFHDRPEGVARVGVVLAFCEGPGARKAAKNEDPGVWTR